MLKCEYQYLIWQWPGKARHQGITTQITHDCWICILILIPPAPPKVEWRCTGFTLTSVWPWTSFQEFFENVIGSIYFISGNYPYAVRLFSPIHFRDPSDNFGPLLAKYLSGKGFPDFLKTSGSIDMIQGINLMVWYPIRVFIFVFVPSIAALLCHISTWKGISRAKNAGNFLKIKFSTVFITFDRGMS